MTPSASDANAVTQFFRGFLRGFASLPMEDGGAGLVEDFAITLHESETSYELKAELPGMAQQDVHVAIERHRVSVCAAITPCKKALAGDKSVCTTPCFATSLQTVNLPHDVDTESASASFESGVLTLTLPKRPGPAAIWLHSH